ncbi:MAG: DeoR/GlpR family DNA-binding transcription regulator [Actinomycetaceae bacterium]|nr:DeoR/GlpR family DNA-binding transcription regulator [Arcanobacterium sp.]MDD7504621.1 DeoR/GlpR family DNA-binding transcription regulator [Actinomycetaceae bacterium]MDY6143063.1 DeoR/GlpR family DNA-binding transcription regulator [Arcanobacterium sp.]
MNRQERLAALLDLVVSNGTVYIDDIVAQLNISPATARRDLDYLSGQQLVSRIRGGVVVNPGSGEVPMRFRAVRNTEHKQAIAHAAVDMIERGDVIALNGGTTTTAIATELGRRLSEDFPFADDLVTVVTNALNIATDLAVRPQVRVVVTGGVARARSYELVGPLASLMYPHISVDKVFLGVRAFDPDHGVFTDNESEAVANRALVGIARKSYAVADSTKFSASAFAKICPVEEFVGVITDSQISDPVRARCESKGLNVIIGSTEADVIARA